MLMEAIAFYNSQFWVRYAIWGVIFNVLCLLPLAMVDDDFEGTVYSETMVSSRFLIAAAFSMGCAVPMLLDMVADIFGDTKHKDWIARLITVLTLFVPEFYAIFALGSPGRPETYAILSNCSTVSVLSAIFSSLSRLGNYSFSNQCLELFFYAYGTLMVFKCFSLTNDSQYSFFSSISGVCAVLTFLFMVFFPNASGFDFKHIIRVSSYSSLTAVEFSWVVYMVSIWVCFLAIYVLNLFTNGSSWSDSDSTNVAGIAYLRALFTVVISILPGRLIHYRAYSLQHEFLMKQAFVKYVSYELNGPLNVLYADVGRLYELMQKLSKVVTDQYQVMFNTPNGTSAKPVVSFPHFRPAKTKKNLNPTGNQQLTINFLNKISSIGQLFENHMFEMHPACIQTNSVLAGLLDYVALDEPQKQILERTWVSPIRLFESVISSLQETHLRAQVRKEKACNPLNSGDEGDPSTLHSPSRSIFELKCNNVANGDLCYIDKEKMEHVLKSLMGSMIYSGFVTTSETRVIVISLLRVQADKSNTERIQRESDIPESSYISVACCGNLRISIGIVDDNKKIEKTLSPESSLSQRVMTLFGSSKIVSASRSNIDSNDCDFGSSDKPLLSPKEKNIPPGHISSVNIFLCGRIVQQLKGFVNVQEVTSSNNFDIEPDRLVQGEVVTIGFPMFNDYMETERATSRSSAKFSTWASWTLGWRSSMVYQGVGVVPKVAADENSNSEGDEEKSPGKEESKESQSRGGFDEVVIVGKGEATGHVEHVETPDGATATSLTCSHSIATPF